MSDNKQGHELPISLGAMLPGSRAGDRPVNYKKLKTDTVAKIQAEQAKPKPVEPKPVEPKPVEQPKPVEEAKE